MPHDSPSADLRSYIASGMPFLRVSISSERCVGNGAVRGRPGRVTTFALRHQPVQLQMSIPWLSGEGGNRAASGTAHPYPIGRGLYSTDCNILLKT